MSVYRIQQLGARIVVGTENEAVLICHDLDVARRTVADAECRTMIPTWQLLSERAARIGENVDPAALAMDVAAMLAEGIDQEQDDCA